VRVRYVVAEARPLAANVADGSHGSLHWSISRVSRRPRPRRYHASRNKAACRAYPKARPRREPRGHG
jgi:hypothetical protein